MSAKVICRLSGLKLESMKELYGLYLSDNEGAKYWLTGFPEAISSLYTQIEFQLCIIHQTGNSMKCVAYKNQRAFTAELRSVYRASWNEDEEVDVLEENWGDTCIIVIKPWRIMWAHLSAYFKCSEPTQKKVYFTNVFEAEHRQFEKLTRTREELPNEVSLLKLLYAGIFNATEKWTMLTSNWSQMLSQCDISFKGRLDGPLDI